MIELLNLSMLGGLAAISAPVIIHFMHRRRIKPVTWAAMQFLRAMPAKSRRRLFLDEWLLLLIRSLILACIAIALLRPAYFASSAGNAGRVERQGRTGAVLLVDDSVSTSSGRGRSAIESMKQLATSYLDTLSTGDEVSLIRTSQLGKATADPIFDLEAARRSVEAIESTEVESDVPGLLSAGLDQMARHVNPGIELVLIHDGRKEGWKVDDEQQWKSLRAEIESDPEAPIGTRRRPRVVMLSPEPRPEANIAVSRIRLDRALIPEDLPIEIDVSLVHYGESDPEEALLRLFVDGRSVEERPVTIEAGETSRETFTYTFEEAGSHVIEAVIEGARDSLAADDRRALSVEVTKSLPVLLVEGATGKGFEGSLGYVAASLDPGGDGRGLFRLDRTTIGRLDDVDFRDFRVMILGDVPALDASTVAKLERFVMMGGGVLVGLGPATQPLLANRDWARGSEGFLPATLGRRRVPPGSLLPAEARVGHYGMQAFEDQATNVWSEAKIDAYYRLDTTGLLGSEVVSLLSLTNGDPVIVERARGRGRVILVTTTLDAKWSDLPFVSAFVPLIRGLTAYLGSVVLPPRNMRPGDRITYCPSDLESREVVLCEDPKGNPIVLEQGYWEDYPARISEPLASAGIYRVRDASGKNRVYYAVNPRRNESRLTVLSNEDLRKTLANVPLVSLQQSDEVIDVLGQTKRPSRELWPLLLMLAVGLLFVESLMTSRQSRRELRASASQTPESGGAA
ncbi:hypothetical protein Pan216_09460 [Planctomycetes bacterium Pan216]|uniref:Aerotolerance regulator N-terminal domain-containing protein n=1 Tax=Kolteria novifilia TaxID=2527975 RepID=A0A518AZG2_9BACT|nr:hypothetical protein Pan216_09460 [Planctomycetes bacterium Pan216]